MLVFASIVDLLFLSHRVLFFHDSINAINAAGCLVVFSGVILYKVSLIYANNAETYSPIEQQNENEHNNDEPIGQANNTFNRITRPRLERTQSNATGNMTETMKVDSPQEETDEFLEEGLQDKMLKLKL